MEILSPGLGLLLKQLDEGSLGHFILSLSATLELYLGLWRAGSQALP